MLTVLSVAYSLAAVRPDTSGGAEQVLAQLDRSLVAAGHQSLVVATEDSQVAGTLIPIPRAGGILDESAAAQACERTRASISAALERWHIDVVHMHGQDFLSCLPPPGVPVLVTLHVPRQWYGSGPLSITRPMTFLNCVSERQRATWPEGLPMLPVIENGVDSARFASRMRKRNFALWLGRISPEKGLHLATDAAELAGIPLIVAGAVYPYQAHQQYFRQRIVPRIGSTPMKLIGPVGFERKRRLLTAARCLLVPSQVEETSSLVAMEALACGTPVIAYPAGALASIVEHGKTGYLVETPAEMALAMHAATQVDPAACRAAALERFPISRMIERYFTLYQQLATPSMLAAS